MSQDNWKESSTAGSPEGRIVNPGGVNAGNEENSKEWRLIEKLMMSLTSEQRKTRRWGIFFKLLTFAYLFGLFFVFSPDLNNSMKNLKSESSSHTALVDIQGVIADQEPASADNIVTGLRAAFEDDGTKGIILRINSPGGSPVQAGYVYDEIMRLRSEYPDTRVYAVISDIGASGAYYIAAAADEIYADKASLVGSIGVTASGFGFVDALEKVGVERRIYTSGDHKTFLDPFSPQQNDEVKFWQSVLNTTHQQFIDQVKKGRGSKLKSVDNLFSGLIWSGEQALELGLIDGLGSSGYVARNLIKEENIVNFTLQPDPFERFAKSFGASVASAFANIIMQSQAGFRLR
ncbi:MAG: S49 family peptidase [Proteobacteria bacterium]|nr:MAG: S49 family peptidase [Pseudomonadota bacterium]